MFCVAQAALCECTKVYKCSLDIETPCTHKGSRHIALSSYDHQPPLSVCLREIYNLALCAASQCRLLLRVDTGVVGRQGVVDEPPSYPVYYTMLEPFISFTVTNARNQRQ
jgi:hypothetical protein